MKKILALVLAVMMLACCLTACGGNDEDVLVCGVTPIPGLNEQLADGSWTGFESEFAMAVGEILGMEVKFQEISWDEKYNELNSGAIDCVWNGFTANSSDDGIKRCDLVDFSYGYMLNQQCIVVKTENLADFTSEADLADKKACVEGGSAGAAYAAKVNASEVVEATAQIDTFREVKFGAVQFAVVDIVLAQNVCGKGDYTDLSIVETITLPSEVYAVGFKQGSELTAKVNAAIKELFENGKMAELAAKYNFTNVLQLIEDIEF